MGYDVWHANNRGNHYAREHIKLKPNQKEFWEFDFVDMGTKDIPDYIDYILKTTKQSKLTLMGHS